MMNLNTIHGYNYSIATLNFKRVPTYFLHEDSKDSKFFRDTLCNFFITDGTKVVGYMIRGHHFDLKYLY